MRSGHLLVYKLLLTAKVQSMFWSFRCLHSPACVRCRGQCSVLVLCSENAIQASA